MEIMCLVCLPFLGRWIGLGAHKVTSANNKTDERFRV